MIGMQRERPLSLAAVVSALALPGLLLLHLTHPAIIVTYPTIITLLVAASISVPILLLCFAYWYSMVQALALAQRVVSGTDARKPREPIERALAKADPLEWPCFLAGGYQANLLLYILVAVAYLRPIRLGASLLFAALILIGLWMLELVVLGIAIAWVKRRCRAPASSIE